MGNALEPASTFVPRYRRMTQASPVQRRLDLLPISVWVLHLVLPLLGLWLLLEQPKFDVTWENHDAHLWLVFLSAAAASVIAFLMGREVSRRGDARLFLVSLMFMVSAGFLRCTHS